MTDEHAMTDEEAEDAAHEQHYLDVQTALTRVEQPDEIFLDTLAEALYAGSELGVLPFDSIGQEDAIAIWRAVESVIQYDFPKNLRM